MLFYLYTSYTQPEFFILKASIGYYLESQNRRKEINKNVNIIYTTLEKFNTFYKTKTAYTMKNLYEFDFIIHKDSLQDLL